ncbi:MAG: DUF4423 domain-containing protein [Deltaproteobacteria bacterium]|nr:DUF4423 domain-containing protein [Deltaproteobacteria bacterium]
MDVLGEFDYKSLVKSRIRELNSFGKSVTLKQLAESIPVQYTHLSRILTGPDKHLSEDHLFALCKLLDFSSDETDYLLLLRSEACTTNLARKRYLQAKLAHIREAKKLKASLKEFSTETLLKEANYLFDPLCVVVHVSLGIDEFRKSPHRLCSSLGISRTHLKEILLKLKDVGFIEFGADGCITKANKAHFHYSPQHPLMRAHQNLLRTLGLSRLSRTDEQDRHSFMVTFSAEPGTFYSIKELFQKFIQDVEKNVLVARNTHTYQISFDLFKWL